MRMDYFGDTFDIVKKSLLNWLHPFGKWSAHPMFTENVDSDRAEEFERFLGIPLVTREVLRPNSNRSEYFRPCRTCQNLFLDPDIGVRLEESRSVESPHYIFAKELIDLVRARLGFLTMVFDQCLARGKEREQIQRKLRHFCGEEVFGFAYVSHTSFVILGQAEIVARAKEVLIKASGLPEGRFVEPPAHS